MKLLSLVTAIGLGIALSVGAQQMQQQPPQQPTDEQQAPTQRGKTKANPDTNVNQEAGPSTGHAQPTQTSEKSRVKAGANAKEGAVSRSTTVFRNGVQTNESLSLHRSVRERTDTHFAIGTHARDWWLRTYSIVFIDGCHYFLADNGCWYPAYGFDPSCNYPVGVVYCD